MKTKILLSLLILLLAFSLKAQSHISKGGYKCLLVPNSGDGIGGVSCPACQVKIKKEREAKSIEEKRRVAAHAEKIKNDRIASVLALEKQEKELAEKNKSTEVFVTMPKSNLLKNTISNEKTEQNQDSNNIEETTSDTTAETPNNNLKSSDFGIPENTPTYTRSELRQQVVTQVAGLAGEVLNGWAEEAKEKEAYEAQRREEQAERNRIDAQIRRQKQQKIVEHTNYITAIKDVKLPLSSSNIEEEVIYYFAFNVDKTALATSTPIICLSDVFPIAKYSDGTWPYTVNIKKELSTILKTPDVVINGYYKSKSEADAEYLIFKQTLEKFDFTITSFTYKGKAKESVANDDRRNDDSSKEKKKSTNETDDFWENSSKEVKEINKAPQTKQVKTPPAKSQTDDFWNN